MANPNLIPAIKLLVKDLSHSDLLGLLKAELGSKERLETLQGVSEWASTQLLSAPAANEKVSGSIEGLSHDNLYATLQQELGKEDRLGVLQCLVDWAVPEHVYAPATSITKVRFSGTVTSYDEDTRMGFINCAEAQEIFGSEVIIEGDQVRKGPRIDDKLTFAILRDSAHKPQAFDILNETVMNKEAERRKGKGERKGKGKKRPREPREPGQEGEDGEEREAGEEDGEDGGRRRKHGKGKGRKQRKGEGRDRDRSPRRGFRDGEGKSRKGGDDGDKSRKGGEKGDRGSFKGAQKGGPQPGQKGGGVFVPPGAKGGGQKGGGGMMGLSIKPSTTPLGVRPIGINQMSILAARQAALGRGGGVAAGQFGKGSLAQSLMRKNLLMRGGMQPRPAMAGGPIPAAGKAAVVKGFGKVANKGGKTENICWNFKNGKCWTNGCPWSHAK